MDINIAFTCAFALLILGVIIGFFLQNQFLDYLHDKHSVQWKLLGSPTLFTNSNIKNNFAVLLFLKTNQFLALNDPRLNRLARRLWAYNIAYFTYFLLMLIFFFWGMIYGNSFQKM